MREVRSKIHTNTHKRPCCMNREPPIYLCTLQAAATVSQRICVSNGFSGSQYFPPFFDIILLPTEQAAASRKEDDTNQGFSFRCCLPATIRVAMSRCITSCLPSSSCVYFFFLLSPPTVRFLYGRLQSFMKKPLRPVWLSPETRLFDGMLPAWSDSGEDLSFTPVICVSSSKVKKHGRLYLRIHTSE